MSACTEASDCSESFVRLPRMRAGSSRMSSSIASTIRSLPRAAMGPRAAALAPLLTTLLRFRFRRRRIDHVDELGRRLRGKRLLGCLERGGAYVGSAPATADAPDRRADLVARRELLALRELGLALLPDREQRRRDEDRRVRTGDDADDERECEVLECRAAEDLE